MIADLKGTPPPGSNPRLDDWASGTRSCSLIYRDKLGARPGRSELIYLLVSLDQYTAENRDGPWEFITRAGLPVVSSHLADDAAMRNQAGRRVVIKGSSRCRGLAAADLGR